MVPRRICYEFSRTGTCKWKNCKFRHSTSECDQARLLAEPNQHGISKTTGRQRISERKLQDWKRAIPSSSAPPHLLHAIFKSFFWEARRLMDADAGVWQAVVKALADEDGLRCIQKLVEQPFEGMANSFKDTVFSTQVLPFLETVTHPNVLSSLVLESSVGTIYNVLFGLNGDRAAKFLNFIGHVISRQAVGENKSWSLEVALLFFSRLVDLNSTALVQDHLHEQATNFEAELALSMSNGKPDIMLHHARASLERLQRRLSVGQSLPAHLPDKKPVNPATTVGFVPLRDNPGGRHDNDHDDICEIKIMPTFQEIQSPSTEYLPVIDPARWHIDGLDGLVDRNFRLLREDTVGQLRDVVHQFLNQASSNRSSKSNLRKNVYRDGKATKFLFDSMSGLQFELTFPQPPSLKGKSAHQIEAWWRGSKRLQPGALVCLVTRRNVVLFCTVAENISRKKSKDVANHDIPHAGVVVERSQIRFDPVDSS